MQTTFSKPMHISLWVVQILLGAMFLMAGFMKLTQPAEQLIQTLPWVADMSIAMVKFIGMSEILGGLGLILPTALKIVPHLTVYAAYGICLIMLLASALHFSRGEWSNIAVNACICFMAYFIAWGRSTKAVIYTKQPLHES